MKRVLSIVTFVLILFVFATGCSNNNTPSDAAAIVNGEKILKTVLEKRTQQVAVMYGYDLEDPKTPTLGDYLKQQVIESMIDEELIYQEAVKLNITVTSEEIDAEMKKLQEQFDSAEKYQEYLEQNKMTDEEYIGFVTNNLYLNKLYEHVTKDITTPSQDPKEYYEENEAEFNVPEKVKARHILLTSAEKAQAAIKRLDKGEDFAELAVELSFDETVKENQGLVGYFSIDEEAIEITFREAAFKLNVGEYSKEPVFSTFGYHVIKVEDRTPAKKYEFEEIKDLLTQSLLQEERKNMFNTEYMDNLRKEAKIENIIKKEIEEKQ